MILAKSRLERLLDGIAAPQFRAASSKKKRKNLCTKGWSCGSTCISKQKGCKKNLPGGQYEAYSQYLERLATQQLKSAGKARTATEPVTQAQKNTEGEADLFDSGILANKSWESQENINSDEHDNYLITDDVVGKLEYNYGRFVTQPIGGDESSPDPLKNRVIFPKVGASQKQVNDFLLQNTEDGDIVDVLESQGEAKSGRFIRENGKFKRVPVDTKAQKALAERTQSLQDLLDTPLENQADKEEAIFAKTAPILDNYYGRKPTGQFGDMAFYRQEAVKWAKQQGLDDAANGFDAEATAAHDVAHPVVHRLLGAGSESISRQFGGFKTEDGRDSMVAEEAIVNMSEWLSRGATPRYALIRGIRLARQLTGSSIPGVSDQERKFFRSPGFYRALSTTLGKLIKADDFEAGMKVVREGNRRSQTIVNAPDVGG